MGQNLGTILGLVVLLNLIKDWDYRLSFIVCGAPIALLACLTPLMVAEPVDLHDLQVKREKILSN